MRYLLFFVGILLSIDGLYCGFTGTMGIGEALIVADGVVFIMWGAFYDAFKEKKLLRFLKRVFAVCMAVFFVYCCTVCIYGRLDNETGRENYVVVLGSQLQNDEPTVLLQNRLDKAVEYLKRNTTATVIVTGRQTKGNNISEARAMSNYLIVHGINSDRIIVEPSAYNTKENFDYSRAYIPNGVKSLFITSDFHVMRAAQLASKCGLSPTAHIGAATPLVEIPVRCAREMLAEIYSIRYYIG